MIETISFTLNDSPVTLRIDSDRPLLWVLRTDLGLTGCKFGFVEAQSRRSLALLATKSFEPAEPADTDRNSGVFRAYPPNPFPFFSCLVWRSCSIDDAELTRRARHHLKIELSLYLGTVRRVIGFQRSENGFAPLELKV